MISVYYFFFNLVIGDSIVIFIRIKYYLDYLDFLY